MRGAEVKMEKQQTEKEGRRSTIIFIAVFAVIAVISFFFISEAASSEGNFTGVYNTLDDKRTNVMELMAGTAAAATAISLIPGDGGTPIADQMADMSSYFMFILAAIFVEKWLVGITGIVAFKVIIPIACLVLILSRFFSKDKMTEAGVKLILFALMIFLVIPISVFVTEKIDASYQESMKQTIEDAKKESEDIRKNSESKDKNALQKYFAKFKNGINGQLEEFEGMLNRITESIAVLIVTSCVIPLAVLAFFIWLIKLMTGISVSVPTIALPKSVKRRGKI